MNKCRICGTEFEGNFCPNCGKRWQDTLVCVHCGAKIIDGAKFCTECGSPIDLGSSAPSAESSIGQSMDQSDEESAVKIFLRKAARFVPSLLLLLFSLLAFFFYIMPVAVTPSGDFLGEKIPSESYGNLYQLIKPNGEEIFVPFLVLLIITIASALFAAFCLLSSKKRYLYTAIRYLFWLFYLVFASVIIAKLGKADEEMGLIKVGSCFILILVFSVVFSVISVILDFFKGKTPEQASVSLTISKSDSDKIAARTYAERTDLYSVKINEGIKRIEREAFCNCPSLCFITVGADVNMIEDNAFFGCVALKQIDFPVSLRQIGWYALCNCINLEKIVFHGTQEQWKHIYKGNMWDDETGEYIIVCNDGDLQKQRPEE